MNILCDNVLRLCLPCNDDPIANISAEDADSNPFVFNFDIVERPPLGFGYDQLGCKRWCYSEESLEDAQLCAIQQTFECVVDTWTEPQTGDPPFGPPGPPGTFLNAEQTCESTCADGATFGATIAHGRVTALSLAEANRIARSLACNLARTQRICILTTSPLTAGCVNTAYSKTLVGRGGTPWVVTFDDLLFVPFCASLGDRFPYTWTIISGSLPDGLELGECSGNISGTPTTAGSYIFTVRATDFTGAFQTKQFTMTVAQISTASPLTQATVNTAYTQNFAVSPAHDQETETWTIIAGTIPVGLTMSTAGILSGTPTVPGTYDFTVNVGFELDGDDVSCRKVFQLVVSGLDALFYWTLDNTLADSVSSALLVTILPNFGVGIINSGFNFIASPNTLITLDYNDPSLTYVAGEDLSCTFWIKWSAGFDPNDQMAIGFGKSAGGDEIDLTIRWNPTTLFLDVDNDVVSDLDSMPFVPVLGDWYFFAATYDYDTGLAKLYMNSVVVLETTIPVQFFSSPTDNRLRCWQIGSIPGTTLDYIFDEYGWYKRELTQADINTLYNGGAGARPPGI